MLKFTNQYYIVNQHPMSQFYKFNLVMNNPKGEAEELIKLGMKHPDCTWVGGQLEKGENGTVHIQYAIQLKKKQRCAAIKKIWPTAHIEGIIRDNNIRKYATKLETRIDGPWEFGEYKLKEENAKKQKTTRDYVDLNHEEWFDLPPMEVIRADKALKICQEKIPSYRHHENRGLWIYGNPGTGKSEWVEKNYPNAFYKD